MEIRVIEQPNGNKTIMATEKVRTIGYTNELDVNICTVCNVNEEYIDRVKEYIKITNFAFANNIIDFESIKEGV